MVAETLISPRLALRPPGASDLDAYTRYCQSPRTAFAGGPFTEVNAFEKLAEMIGHWAIRGHGRYVLERDGEPIGHAGPLSIGPGTPELTWSLWTDAAERHGYATEAAKTVADHLLKDCNWPVLDILIQKDNTASHAVAGRLGARHTDRAAPDWYPGCITYELDAGCLA